MLIYLDSWAKEWLFLQIPIATAQGTVCIGTDVLIDPNSLKAKNKARWEQMLVISSEETPVVS